MSPFWKDRSWLPSVILTLGFILYISRINMVLVLPDLSLKTRENILISNHFYQMPISHSAARSWICLEHFNITFVNHQECQHYTSKKQLLHLKFTLHLLKTIEYAYSSSKKSRVGTTVRKYKMPQFGLQWVLLFLTSSENNLRSAEIYSLRFTIG